MHFERAINILPPTQMSSVQETLPQAGGFGLRSMATGGVLAKDSRNIASWPVEEMV